MTMRFWTRKPVSCKLTSLNLQIKTGRNTQKTESKCIVQTLVITLLHYPIDTYRFLVTITLCSSAYLRWARESMFILPVYILKQSKQNKQNHSKTKRRILWLRKNQNRLRKREVWSPQSWKAAKATMEAAGWRMRETSDTTRFFTTIG